VESLDLTGVVRASQILAGTIVLDQVVDRLMRIALDIAAADRALLIHVKLGFPTVEAEARRTPQGEIAILIGPTAPTTSVLPTSILGHVLQTHESVILSDAPGSSPFRADEYVAKARPRSVFCLPLMRQGVLTGALYLESALTPGAFTPARVSALTTLAPQAAISVENARLYGEVNLAGERLKRAIDMIPTLAWSASADGRTQFANKQWLDYVGVPGEGAFGLQWGQAFHPEDATGVEAWWRSRVDTGRSGETEARIRGRDGEYRWFLVRAEPYRDERGDIVEWFGTNTDIDDLKRAEAEIEWRLQLSEISASFASAPVDALDDCIHRALHRVGELVGADRLTIFWLEDRTVRPESVLVWRRPGAVLAPRILPSVFDTAFDSLRRGEAVMFPIVGGNEDERRVEREALASIGGRSALALPLVIGGDAIAAMSFIWASRLTEWPDDTMPRMRLLAEVFADAFARKRMAHELGQSAAALGKAQRELAHVARVTTVGELAASLVHEIGQPVAAIIANADAGADRLRGENVEAAREFLDAIAADAEQAAQVLTRIRALLARSPNAMMPCDVSAVVLSILPVVRGQLLRDGVAIETALAEPLPKVLADPVQLQQVILNLVLNAADASRDLPSERRRVRVSTYADASGGSREVLVAVEDSGIGIAKEDGGRLFTTFYSTKPAGLGMGLAISRSIVERHGGRLWAEANPEHGATFRFALPESL
jgi:PAS domain S-box-containing protein